MWRILSVLLICAVGCASAGPSWKRADGSPFTEEQLRVDRLTCFPDVPAEGTGPRVVHDARDCMQRRGWVRASE